MHDHIYYNDFNPHAAQWLRNLMDLGAIPRGFVDTRDIRDVRPVELLSYRQCHFFAGIGVWASSVFDGGYLLDDRIWTASLPCQPFSAAGRGAGVSDERHLWPHFFHLVTLCKPPEILGEQVASKDGLGWWDLVSTDLEAAGYACGTGDLCAPGVGAPHIHQRLYWGAYDTRSAARLEHAQGDRRDERGAESGGRGAAVGCSPGRLADACDDGSQGRLSRGSDAGRQDVDDGSPRRDGPTLGMADADGARQLSAALGILCGREEGRGPRDGESQRSGDVGRLSDADCTISEFSTRQRAGPNQEDRAGPCGEPDGFGQSPEMDHRGRPGAVDGFWRDADWLFSRDGKWRPARPGSFPLVDGSAFDLGSGGPFEGKSRQKILQGYGNAIVKPLAVEFVKGWREALADLAVGDLT